MRYIDIVRTVVRNAQEKDIPALTWDEQRHHLNAIRQKIDDIEIVVRCKDCRWYEQKQKHLPYNVSKRYCNRSCVLATKENDFCSYGERKEP